jgi:thiamine-phosphate pyrophosphorylase
MKNIDLKKREALKSPFFYTYLITDPKYYGTDMEIFEQSLKSVLENFSIDMVCFRDKETKDIKPLAKKCLEITKYYGIKKTLLNGNIKLAYELGFDGVHLTSMQFENIVDAKENALYTLISTHNEEEIKEAKEKKADGVTYSPIFFKEKKAEPKGCQNLKSMIEKFQEDSFDIFALGGITTKKNLEEVKKTACKGFATISYFFE